MEHCYWPYQHGGSVPARFARVYLGEEGCGLFLSSPGFLRRVLALMAEGRAVTVVTPALTPQRERDLAALLQKLPAPTEVVAGDIGAFALIAQAGHIPIAGRLMSRQSTDPAIAGFTQTQQARVVQTADGPRRLEHRPPPDELMEHFCTPPILSAGSLQVLQSLAGGPPRVELDAPPHGLPQNFPQDISVSLHADECLLAVAACHGCEDCPQEPVPAGAARTGMPLHRHKNLLLYPVSIPSPPKQADRLIWRTQKPVPVSGVL